MEEMSNNKTNVDIEMTSRRSKLKKLIYSVNFKLYCFYGFSTWTEQMWMFAAGMAFGSFGGDLQLAASAAFVASAAVLIFGPILGRWIDHSNRLRAAMVALVGCKIAACVTTAFLAAMLVFQSSLSKIFNGEILSALSVICIFANMVSILATSASKIIITKDWVVVICKCDEERLTAANAILMRINLISLIVSPYIAGQIMEWTSVGIGCFVISLLITVTFLIEYFLLRAVHHAVPGLSDKCCPNDVPQSRPLMDSPTNNVCENNQPSQQTSSRSLFTTISTAMTKFLHIWRVYWHQRVLLAGISLSLLYMTVLGFDSITDVYAYSQGLKANTIALAKGCGALAGIFGTFAYPKIRRRIGLIKTGIVALVLELSCLILPVLSIWLPGSPFDPSGYFAGKRGDIVDHDKFRNCSMQHDGNEMDLDCDFNKLSIRVFLIGLVLSRFGLWMSDLTINQLFQKTVSESERASVNSVQHALNNLMDMLKNILVIFMPNPKTFGLLTIFSWSFVFMSLLCYLVFVKRSSGSNDIEIEKENEESGCIENTGNIQSGL